MKLEELTFGTPCISGSSKPHETKQVDHMCRGPVRVNSDKQHDPKVATECKMKSRQETTSLSQIATVMAKPRVSVGQRTLDWLIYHQSECQEEVIFINFP